VNSKNFWFINLHIVCCVLLILFLAGLGLITGFLNKNVYLVIIGFLIIGIALYIFIKKRGYKHGE